MSSEENWDDYVDSDESEGSDDDPEDNLENMFYEAEGEFKF